MIIKHKAMEARKFWIIASLFLAVTATSPKLMAQTDEGQEEAADDSGTGSEECLKQMAIFTDNAKLKDYQYALPAFRYLMEHCLTPGTGLYIRGENMLHDLIKKESNDSLKQLYVDTLFQLLDRRMEAAAQEEKYGSKGFIIGRKVIAMAAYRKNEVDTIYALSKQAVELEREQTAGQVMYIHMIYTAFLRKANKLDCGDVIDAYNTLNEFIEKGMEMTEGQDSIRYKNYSLAQKKVDELAGPCLTCDNLMEILERDYEAKSADSGWVRKTSAALDRRACAKNEAYQSNALLVKIMEQNANMFPNATAFLRLGRQYSILKNTEKAIEAFEKAIALESDSEKKARYYMVLASAQSEAGQYSGARSSARSAAELKPNWGNPYIFIGDLYVSSFNRCKTDDPCTSYGAYWAAVDMYQKARSVDPSAGGKAQSRINSVAGSYPLKSDCFFVEKRDGDAVSVGCWIQTSTTVRTR